MRRMSVIIILLLLVFLSACGRKEEAVSSSRETITVVDVLGRYVEIPESPRRIISLTPNITETLFAIGAGDLLVGRIDYDDYPSEALKLPSVGGGINPNLESIVALNPDLILCDGIPSGHAFFSEMERLNIPVVDYHPQNLDEIHAMITSLGKITGRQEGARVLLKSMSETEARVQKRAAQMRHHPRVYIEISENPFMSAGPQSFLSDLVRRAGGENILTESEVLYPVVDAEFVIALKPEVILFLHSTSDNPCSLLKNRSGWSNLPAVKNKFIIGGGQIDVFVRPGPRVVQGLDQISKMMEAASVLPN